MALQGTPVVRYPLDEAASGTTPTSALDVSGNGYHLTTINYGSSTMAYTEVSGNRGLVSTSGAGTHRASRAINNTADAVRTALAGAQRATLEVVVDMDLGNGNGGRIVAITDRAGGTGQFGLRQNSDADNWIFFFNGTTFNLGLASATGLSFGSRHVLQVVLDTTQATQADRVRICVNGGSFIQVSNSIALNATLSLPSNLDLILLNRESSGSFARSVECTLFYAAIYAEALTLGQCQNNATDLAADDDPAASGPPPAPPQETLDRTGTRAPRPGRGPYSLGRYFVRTKLDAFPAADLQSTSIAQASETDAAQPLASAQARQLAQASEANAAQPMATAQARQLAQAAEANSAQPMASAQAGQVAQASEANSAQPLASAQAEQLAQAAETDLAQPVATQQARTLGQAAEDDVAQALTPSLPGSISPASEANAAQPMQAAQARAVGQAAEADEALPCTVGGFVGSVGLAAEEDAAQALALSFTGIIGQAGESNEALPMVQEGTEPPAPSPEAPARGGRRKRQNRLLRFKPVRDEEPQQQGPALDQPGALVVVEPVPPTVVARTGPLAAGLRAELPKPPSPTPAPPPPVSAPAPKPLPIAPKAAAAPVIAAPAPAPAVAPHHTPDPELEALQVTLRIRLGELGDAIRGVGELAQQLQADHDRRAQQLDKAMAELRREQRALVVAIENQRRAAILMQELLDPV